MRSWVESRRQAFVLFVALMALLVAIPVAVLGQTTSTTFVTGTITTKDPLTFSGSAIAVITLVDRSARGQGVILGQQRIAAPATPLAFKVRYDPARVDPTHAYVVFAAVIDGAKQWHNNDGVPVITGGPTTEVVVKVTKVNADPVTTIPGEIVKTDKSSLSGKAVALAAVLDAGTGRTVAWTALTPSGQVPIAFSLGYDPATVDQGAILVTWAAIVDTGKVWESAVGTPLVAAGTDLSAGTITVVAAVPLPAAPSPTPTPTPVTIPAVKDQPESEAVQTLEGVGLVVGETGRKYNQGVAEGNAVKTSPEAGVQVASGSSVKLIVSKGPSPSPSPAPTPKPTAKPTPKPTATPRPTTTPKPTPSPVAVPDVRDQPEATAVDTITGVGLTVAQVERRYNDKVKEGNALKTDPAAGSKVKVGSAVDLYISRGPSPSPSPTPSPTVTPRPTPSWCRR